MLCRWGVALACGLICHAVQADRSRLGEGEELIEPGDCEVEVAFERRSGRAQAREHEQNLELACGIGWRTELALSIARQRSHGSRERTAGVEARTSLLARSGNRIGWSLIAGVQRQGVGNGAWRSEEHSVAIEAALQPGAAWLFETRLGTARDRLARNDRTTWELAAERAFGEVAELRLSLAGDDRQRPTAKVVLRHSLVPDWVSVALSFGVRGGPQRERSHGLAFTIEF